jgi:hypothetical protein
LVTFIFILPLIFSLSFSVSLFLSRSTAESNCPIHKPNSTYLSAIDSLSCSLRGVILSRCPESGGGGVFGAVRGAPVVFGSGIVFMSLRVFCFHACSIFLLGSRVFCFCRVGGGSVSGDGGGGSFPLRLGTVISSLLSQTN